MSLLIGIDVGTSGLKTIIVGADGEKKASAYRQYLYELPAPGYAEQNPEIWWSACVETVREALSSAGVSGAEIAAVGFSGQMHGAVLLDKNYIPVRPVILHCDTRSGKQVEYLKARLGAEKIARLMRNPVYTGFLLCSLLWVRDNEPEIFARVHKVCLPKDYIKYRLSGVLNTDCSDASGTLAFDIEAEKWSSETAALCGIDEDFFPPVLRCGEAAGRVTKSVAEQTGLAEGTPVDAGCADQLAQRIGNGAVTNGTVTSNIGSSGQICFQSDVPLINPALSTNLFCAHKKGKTLAAGAIMFAGLALSWLCRLLGRDDYAALDDAASSVPPGAGGLIFLPHLNGERTPHMNPDLRALFAGFGTETGTAQTARSVMEGVVFALNQCMEVLQNLGLKADSVIASGGGSRSRLWMQIQADVFGMPVKKTKEPEAACLGAAIAAGTCAGVYSGIEEGCAAAVRFDVEEILPVKKNHAVYKDYYAIYKDTFNANKIIFEKLARIRNTGV